MPKLPLPPAAPSTPPATGSGAALPLPHERDEAIGQVAPRPDPVIRQAAKDLAAGQVDTDMRATPGLDADRRGGLVPTSGPVEPPDPRPPRR